MCSTRLLSLAAILATLGAAAFEPNVRTGVGTVAGTGRATYVLRSLHPITLPSMDISGFSQKARPLQTGWQVEVAVDPSGFLVRQPISAKEKALPTWVAGPMRKDLASALNRCQRQGDAAEAVLLFFRQRLNYVERAGFPETSEEVLRRGEASCLGMTRLCQDVLRSQGITSREVLGLKLPVGASPYLLSGGALHAWLELDFGPEGRAFYDPWRSCGWVPESYIALRVGGGLEPGEFAVLAGGTLEVVSREDRVFFEPAPGLRCLLWKRPERESFSGTLVTGKVMGAGDVPKAGRATLRSPAGEVSMELWEGNFFFRDLEPGSYALSIEAPGVPPEGAPVQLKPMDKLRFLVYSQEGRERGKNGAGRQP